VDLHSHSALVFSWSYYQATLGILKNGKTEHLRFTGVWMKQSGDWQEVARHTNIVPQP
jgi:hypothetical protein